MVEQTRLVPAAALLMTAISGHLLRLGRWALFTGLAALTLGAGWVVWRAWLDPDAEFAAIYHLPAVYFRRADDLTANVTGYVSDFARSAEYRLNGGPWLPVPHGVRPRLPRQNFTIEIEADRLLDGDNSLELRARSLLGRTTLMERQFRYDSQPVTLPFSASWEHGDLDVQDGTWEAFEQDGEMRVRPRLGYEAYDRLLMVAGAFPGGRRVETDLVFHGFVSGSYHGFGVFPLWGGHPDQANVYPRRGWSFGAAWYYSKTGSVGAAFSYKFGDQAEQWAEDFQSLDIRAEVRYRIIAEARPMEDADGHHAGYHLRMKWWAEDEPEPQWWLEAIDQTGAPLPEGDYAVALLAHKARVDFGPVYVSPLLPERLPRHDGDAEVESLLSLGDMRADGDR